MEYDQKLPVCQVNKEYQPLWNFGNINKL